MNPGVVHFRHHDQITMESHKNFTNALSLLAWAGSPVTTVPVGPSDFCREQSGKCCISGIVSSDRVTSFRSFS